MKQSCRPIGTNRNKNMGGSLDHLNPQILEPYFRSKYKLFACISIVVLFVICCSPGYGASLVNTGHSGKVVDVMDAGTYTYMQIDEDGNKFWIAAPQTIVKTGEYVNFEEEVWMSMFKSKTLNRTFDRILFVSKVDIVSEQQSKMPESSYGHTPGDNATDEYGIPKSKTAEPPERNSITKAEGGYTVEELFSQKNELKGKIVKVRGKVVKVSKNIMGRHWVHIKDGTGVKDANDLTFTSVNNPPEVGSVVVAEGRLAVDKNFGGGYKYPAIVEDAAFSK
ncbi:MAG: DNA-binding protein [Nitrospirota bacterium]